MKVTPQFRISEYDDYHEIQSPNGWKAIELGCFPSKKCSYNRYFALYYKGRRPLFEKIMKSLLSKIPLEDKFHFRTGEKLNVTREDVKHEVKEMLKPKVKK